MQGIEDTCVVVAVRADVADGVGDNPGVAEGVETQAARVKPVAKRMKMKSIFFMDPYFNLIRQLAIV
jgi:hypothetical protein